MDAISAAAEVSKRTVYDYYGDKANLLVAVVRAAADALLVALHGSLDDHLSDQAPIRTPDDLERALTAFADDISTTVVGSANYTTIFVLTSGLRAKIPPLDGYLHSRAPEDAIAERLAHFGSLGLLDISDAGEAADHFNALTMLLAYSNQPDPARADREQVHRTVTGGVHAFMRAYGSAGRH